MIDTNSLITVEGVSMPLLELISELAEQATYTALTEQMYTLSEAQCAEQFSEQHLYTTPEGDIRYKDEAQEIFNTYHDYYEAVIMNLFDPLEED